MVTKDCTGQFDIRYGINATPGVEPKRAVIFINGRNEWIEKYENLPNELHLKSDTLFLTWDHRGQGKSGGDRGNVETYDFYAQDLKNVLKVAEVESLPYVVISHSMGGLITLYSYMLGFLNPKAIVLCSPLLEMPNHPLPRAVARPVSRIATALGFGNMSTLADKHRHRPFALNKLTHDKETYHRNIHSGFKSPGARFLWVKKTYEALAYIYRRENIKKLKAPIFIQGSGQEQVVDNIGVKNWCLQVEHYANIEVTATIIPGAKHELFSESDDYRKPALANVHKWIGRYL